MSSGRAELVNERINRLLDRIEVTFMRVRVSPETDQELIRRTGYLRDDEVSTSP
jgi:hypothetical protein